MPVFVAGSIPLSDGFVSPDKLVDVGFVVDSALANMILFV